MENYNQTKNKLSKLWEQIQRNELTVAQIKRLNINYKSANYCQAQRAYLIDDTFFLPNTYLNFKSYYALVKLTNWEEADTAYLKLLVIFNPFSPVDYGLMPTIYNTSMFVVKNEEAFYACIYISCGRWNGAGRLQGKFYLQIHNWKDYYAI
jgi:hypothetical protein